MNAGNLHILDDGTVEQADQGAEEHGGCHGEADR